MALLLAYRRNYVAAVLPHVAAALAAACLALAFGEGPARASIGSPPAFPAASGPDSLGVNIHFTDPRPGEMDLLALAGFHWVRMDFGWAGIERERGVYDFSAYDRLVAQLKRHRMRAIFILDYGNDLYEQGSPRTPEARAAFARFAVAGIRHFRGDGIVWEMWNEPNISFWKPKPDVEQYIALATEVGRAIRRIAPDAQFIGPGVSGMDFKFLEACFRAGLLQYWDAVSFHPYRLSPPETASADYEHVRSLIAQYGPAGRSIPILSSEWGYSERYPGLNLDLQSKYIARQALSNMMAGLVISIWYDWHDDGTDPNEPEDHFGVVDADYRIKTTYLAIRTLCTTLRGFRFDRRIDVGSARDYCLAFRRGDTTCYAFWTTGSAPHAVGLPVSDRRFHIVGPLGEHKEVEAAANGAVGITLDDTPHYLAPY